MANFFPRWTNTLPLKLAVCLLVVGTGVVLGVTYYFTPKYMRVGYQPSQPVPFSHKLHAGQLGLDCRYCHSFVEESGFSNVPSSSTCWNCHQHVKKDSPRLERVRQSIDPTFEGYDGKPIEWVRIHRVPDYAYFDHSAHVNRGVSCVSCHGQVNEMTEVYHAEPHSMGWCLECHRAPEKNLRPLDMVFDLDWKPEDMARGDFYQHLLDSGSDAAAIGEALELPDDGVSTVSGLVDAAQARFGDTLRQEEIGTVLKSLWNVNPPESCAGCHR